MTSIQDRLALPDEPWVYGADCGGYQQRWAPGAFGDKRTLAGVTRFKVHEDEWNHAGTLRTILRATALA